MKRPRQPPLAREISDLDNEGKDEAKYVKLIPFAKEITDLEDARPAHLEPLLDSPAQGSLLVP